MQALQDSNIVEIYSITLNGHPALSKRLNDANKKLEEIKSKFKYNTSTFLKDICIFCVGSIGRGDVSKHSDLDLFPISAVNDSDRSNLNDTELLANIINVNRELGYKTLSNGGQYLKVYSIDSMLKALGAPQDDSENLFTARMLLLLEGRCAYNENVFNESLSQIIKHYFRDSRNKKAFRPLFLLNDLLRFWRTLCLNYESIRNDERPWIKKNINLKFSRMLTVFGTVLPLISTPMENEKQVMNLCSKTPLQRFAYGLDLLKDDRLEESFSEFLNNYEKFIDIKEKIADKSPDGETLKEIRNTASEFSDFIFTVVNHEKIDRNLKKYLVL